MSRDLLALLGQLDEARAKATPGEWYTGDSALGIAMYSDSESRPGIGQTYMPADAALIVAAVNALPTLTAALRAVGELHISVTYDRWDNGTDNPAAVVRGRCRCCGNFDGPACPTVTAIAAALTPEQVQP